MLEPRYSVIGGHKHQIDIQSNSNQRDLEPAIVDTDTGVYELGSIIIVDAKPNFDRLDDPFICIDEMSSSIALIRALIETPGGGLLRP